MDRKARNLGQAHLVAKLRERGVSRGMAVRILKADFDEMNQALARGEEVEFSFGLLHRVKHVSRRWQLTGDEPMNAYIVERELDAAGCVLFSREGRSGRIGFDSLPALGKSAPAGSNNW